MYPILLHILMAPILIMSMSEKLLQNDLIASIVNVYFSDHNALEIYCHHCHQI